MAATMPRYVVVIRRDHPTLLQTLVDLLGVEAVRWDRRQAARRVAATPVGTERRRRDRRRAPPGRRATVGFVVVALQKPRL